MSNEHINFTTLLAKMDRAQQAIGDVRPVIVGGRFAHSELTQFLATWQPKWQAMPYRIWEQINEIGFHEAPQAPNYLLRGEVFGTGGHLSLRRDGNRWLWHFIGPAGTVVGSEWGDEAFWNEKTEREVKLRRYPENVILWGLNDHRTPSGIWWEDRVGAAKLNYPSALKEHERVYLHFWRYTEGGQTAFVWYRELNGKAASNE